MISLSYVAAYDPYHAIFRMLALLDRQAVPIDALRIVDFYLCFPWLLTELRPARNIEGQVKALNQARKQYQPSPYQLTPSSQVLFQRMRPAQLAAMNSLAANGYLDAAAFKESHAVRTPKPLPEKLAFAVAEYVQAHADLLSLLRSVAEIPLLGSDGLKARSSLQEYRYDNV